MVKTMCLVCSKKLQNFDALSTLHFFNLASTSVASFKSPYFLLLAATFEAFFSNFVVTNSSGIYETNVGLFLVKGVGKS